MSRLIDADALKSIKYHQLPYTHIVPDGVNVEAYERGWNDAVDAIVEDAPTIEPEPKWIPCSDVPDTDRNVFIARGDRTWMSVCIGHYEYGRWYEDRNWFATFIYDELYWCEIPPLPEPYKGYEP